MASIDTYRASIRSSIRGYWSGRLSQSAFIDSMISTINRGLSNAWLAGARDCSQNINDLTIEERTKLALFINDQLSYVQNLAADIAVGSKDEKGKLGGLIARADMWANKWNEVKQTAEAMCKSNEKREWVLGPTEHCKTCSGLSGRVYRFSTWLDNIVPPSHKTQCRGYRCLCRLLPTTRPITKGKFPASLLVR